MHSGKQFQVFNGCLGDPTFIHRQGHDFRFGLERHDYLNQLLGDGIEDHLHIPRHHRFSDLFRHDQPEHFDKEFVQVRLSLFQWKVHHRSGIADRSKRKPGPSGNWCLRDGRPHTCDQRHRNNGERSERLEYEAAAWAVG